MNTIGKFSSFNPNFGKSKNAKKEVNKADIPMHSDKKLEKEKCHSFLMGMTCASIILAGVHACENNKRDFLLDNMAMEVKYSKPEDIKIKVEDATDDGVPDFIIEDEYGSQTIYDVKNKSSYYKDEDVMEKLY